MKEPQPDKEGNIVWNHTRVTAALVQELKSYGYEWNETEECYQFDSHKIKCNDEPTRLSPISFEPDAFHRAVHPAYGGDCKCR
jgi:hypothetical protein